MGSVSSKEFILLGFIMGFVLTYLMMSYSIDRGCREDGKVIIWDLTFIKCEVIK